MCALTHLLLFGGIDEHSVAQFVRAHKQRCVGDDVCVQFDWRGCFVNVDL
jgi:hypothetical protein